MNVMWCDKIVHGKIMSLITLYNKYRSDRSVDSVQRKSKFYCILADNIQLSTIIEIFGTVL